MPRKIASVFFKVPPNEVLEVLSKHSSVLFENAKEEAYSLELFTRSPKQLLEFYIEPNAQNVNPADFAEDDTGLIADKSVFEMLDKFLGGLVKHSHAFVLSDAGMGKTSLMVLLKLAELDALTDESVKIELLKLGNDTEDRVAAITDRSNTVLLLDALDEDPTARDNFYSRVQYLLRLTEHFRKTIITCRTNFFPDKHERDTKIPGVVTLHGFRSSLVFLSPFTDSQVAEYLEKKFPDDAQRVKAEQIVNRMASLKFRPMLLAYIDYLIDRDDDLSTPYEIFHALVDEWLNREQRKIDSPVKDILYETCREIALHIYENTSGRLTQEQLQELCEELGVTKQLDEMTIEGRSLLQKTSDHNYKFAHYSIVEYFVAATLLKKPRKLKNTDQTKNFILDNVGRVPNISLCELDLSRTTLSVRKAPSLNVKDADLSASRFNDLVLHHSAFNRSNLTDTAFEDCDLSNVNFSGSVLLRTSASSSDLSGTLWKDCIPDDVSLTHCILHDIVFDGMKWLNSQLIDCTFVDIEFNDVLFPSCSLNNSTFRHGVFTNCDFEESLLQRTVFDSVKFEACCFTLARLQNSSFLEAWLFDCDFEAAELTDSKITQSNLSKCFFGRARLSRVLLDHVECSALTFSQNDLLGATFDSCVLNDVSFSDSDMSGCVFRGCKFGRANIVGCRGERTMFDGSSMPGVKFQKIMFDAASFRNCDLFETEFRGASLLGCDFRDARLEATDFRNANLSGSDLSGHDLRSSKFLGATLRSTDLGKVRIIELQGMDLTGMSGRHANLDGANLDKADLTDANLDGATLVGAQLKNAKMKNCSIVGANLSGSTLEGANVANLDARGANFTGAKTQGAIFQRVLCDANTKLPNDLTVAQKRAFIDYASAPPLGVGVTDGGGSIIVG